MRLRFLPSLLIFISAYSPLAIIFLIQDYDYDRQTIAHPAIVWSLLALSAISCLLTYAAVRLIHVSSPPVVVQSASNQSGSLINYSIPYMITFFVMDLGNMKLLLSFGFFMIIMYFLTMRTHNIFINPILVFLGYGIYDVCYVRNGKPCQDFFLVKGERLEKGEHCRVAEVSQQMFVVTERKLGGDL